MPKITTTDHGYILETNFKIAGNGSRLGEVVDFEKPSLKFITNVK